MCGWVNGRSRGDVVLGDAVTVHRATTMRQLSRETIGSFLWACTDLPELSTQRPLSINQPQLCRRRVDRHQQGERHVGE
jgi:hypothetical protein